MASKIEKIVPEPVVALQVRVEQWRENKGKKCRMPQSLWEEAARLARQYGVNFVSGYLTLGYASLKQKARGNWGPVKTYQSAATGFVDITTSSVLVPSLNSSNEMELLRPDGHRVVIRNADSACVSRVAKEFFGSSR